MSARYDLGAVRRDAYRQTAELERHVIDEWNRVKNLVCGVCRGDLPAAKLGKEWHGRGYCSRECRGVMRQMEKADALLDEASGSGDEADWERYRAKAASVDGMVRGLRESKGRRALFVCGAPTIGGGHPE